MQFRRDALIRKYGAEITLPELLQKLTECPRQAGAEEACGMTYANLRSGISQKITPDHLDGLLGIPPTL
jgi:hypothetical protein